MKKIALFIIPILIISCIRNPSSTDFFKYTKEDLIPLNDSTKTLYYNDASYIEFVNLTNDSLNKYIQVRLNVNNIQSYYNDLINIYNNCYNLSNSLFENINRIHTYWTSNLFNIHVSVDTSKSWTKQWIQGNKFTGISKLDTLIEKYNLNVLYLNNTKDRFNFIIKSEIPINYLALIKQLEETEEFKYVETNLIIGSGSTISLEVVGNYNVYKYSLRWGDCPSGCLYNHYWKIKVQNNKLLLLEESGDSL